jgi:transcriptional regulator with XRE-family HTH domain
MASSWDSLVKRTTTKATREQARHRTRELMAEMLLVEMRKLTGKSQRELAKALGTRQPRLSRLKDFDDLHVTMLKRLVEILGGELEVRVRFTQPAAKAQHAASSLTRDKSKRPPQRQTVSLS